MLNQIVCRGWLGLAVRSTVYDAQHYAVLPVLNGNAGFFAGKPMLAVSIHLDLLTQRPDHTIGRHGQPRRVSKA